MALRLRLSAQWPHVPTAAAREDAEARRLAEEEARRLAEEEAARLAALEAERRAAEEEEARRRAEEEARRRRGGCACVYSCMPHNSRRCFHHGHVIGCHRLRSSPRTPRVSSTVWSHLEAP